MKIVSRKKQNEIPFDQISKEIPYHFKLIRPENGKVDYEFDGYLVEFTGKCADFMDLGKIPFGYYLVKGAPWILKAYPLERKD